MEQLDKIINGLLGVPAVKNPITREKLLADLMTRTTAYMLLKKNNLPLDIRKQIEAGQLYLQEGLIYHTAAFSTALSGNVNLVQADHQSGPFWSSLVKGQTPPDTVFLIEAFGLVFSQGSDIQNLYWKYLTDDNVLSKVQVEVQINNQIVLDSAVEAVNFQYSKEKVSVNGKHVFDMRYPVIVPPSASVQITLKFPQGASYTPASGNNVYFHFYAYGMQTYKK